jgi:predicted nucleotidyltransferase
MKVPDALPYPVLFITVSGAHLYGFPSEDSDWGLRGVHVVPTAVLAGLDRVEETIKIEEGETDLVTHEARKFFRFLLRDNGYVLEQLYSPLVLSTTPEHEELKHIARGCVTRTCVRHYLGFAANQWQLFEGHSPRRVKPLLYVFRVLLSGIHMMRTGTVNANLPECNREIGLPYIDTLIERKRTGGERGVLTAPDVAFYGSEYERLRTLLVEASERSTLPDTPTARPALADLLQRIRSGAYR